jgi:phosphoglycolate phosphatase-like HAD superfamily hydrolase
MVNDNVENIIFDFEKVKTDVKHKIADALRLVFFKNNLSQDPEDFWHLLYLLKNFESG